MAAFGALGDEAPGFCTEEEYQEFIRSSPLFEEMLIRSISSGVVSSLVRSQLPRYMADALADRAADPGGASSALSISSKVRPLGSYPNTQKPIRPSTYHEAK